MKAKRSALCQAVLISVPSEQLDARFGAGTIPVADWVEKIKKVWARGPASTLELARAVGAAKSQLRHGQWQQVWKALPFSRRKADMLAVIGRRLHWVKRQMFANLPVGWSILYELAKLERATFEELVRKGMIHPALKLWEARKFVAQCQGKSVEAYSSKARVQERLRRFEDFVRATLPNWTAEERTLGTQRLTRLLEQISDGAVFAQSRILTAAF